MVRAAAAVAVAAAASAAAAAAASPPAAPPSSSTSPGEEKAAAPAAAAAALRTPERASSASAAAAAAPSRDPVASSSALPRTPCWSTPLPAVGENEGAAAAAPDGGTSELRAFFKVAAGPSPARATGTTPADLYRCDPSPSSPSPNELRSIQVRPFRGRSWAASTPAADVSPTRRPPPPVSVGGRSSWVSGDGGLRGERREAPSKASVGCCVIS